MRIKILSLDILMIIIISTFIGPVFASDEEDPNIKPIDIIVQQPIEEDMNHVPLSSPIYLFFTNHSVNQTLIEDSISLREALTSKPVGNLTFNWATTGKGVAIEHDSFLPGTDYILELEPGLYGENGAYCRSHLYLAFTTDSCPPYYDVFRTPYEVYVNEEIEGTAYNRYGYPVRIIARLHPISEERRYFELLNLILDCFEERNITLDFSEIEPGAHKLVIKVLDPQTGELIVLRERQIEIREREREESDEEKNKLSILLIALTLILILVIIVAVFLIKRMKKSLHMKNNEKEYH